MYLEFYDSLLPSIRRTIDRHVRVTGLGFEPEHTTLVTAVIAGDENATVEAARALFAELTD